MALRVKDENDEDDDDDGKLRQSDTCQHLSVSELICRCPTLPHVVGVLWSDTLTVGVRFWGTSCLPFREPPSQLVSTCDDVSAFQERGVPLFKAVARRHFSFRVHDPRRFRAASCDTTETLTDGLCNAADDFSHGSVRRPDLCRVQIRNDVVQPEDGGEMAFRWAGRLRAGGTAAQRTKPLIHSVLAVLRHATCVVSTSLSSDALPMTSSSAR